MSISFDGLGMSLGNLPRLSHARTRSISAENPDGGKGQGGMATTGASAVPSRELGRGWKVSPCLDLAASGALPDAEIADELLKVKPLTKSVPEEAEQLEAEIYGTVPHLKITELLLEVDQWTNFTRHFTHLREDTPAKDRSLLLTVILADAAQRALYWLQHRRLPRGKPARSTPCPTGS